MARSHSLPAARAVRARRRPPVRAEGATSSSPMSSTPMAQTTAEAVGGTYLHHDVTSEAAGTKSSPSIVAPARPPRRPREQRRHLDDRRHAQHSSRRLPARHRGQPGRRLPRHAGRLEADDRTGRRLHREHHVHRRPAAPPAPPPTAPASGPCAA